MRVARRLRALRLTAGAAEGAGERLQPHVALILPHAAPGLDAAAWSAQVLGARHLWTSDFGGEQFALGRAFYTHLETGRAAEYFAGAEASDAVVESVLPGVAGRSLEVLASLLGGTVRRRAGFCGPGVHVFPAGGKVAREGGVVHHDLEGLTEHQKARQRAVTLVWTFQPAAWGGGLRLWDQLYDGRPDTELDVEGIAHLTVRAEAGDALLIDSRRLHQIRPFRGARDRISLTVHAVEVDRGVWEAWF